MQKGSRQSSSSRAWPGIAGSIAHSATATFRRSWLSKRASPTTACRFYGGRREANGNVQALAVRGLAAAQAALTDGAKADVEHLSPNYGEGPELGKTVYEVAEVAYANSDWTWSEELFAKLAAKGKSSKFYVPGVSGQAWSLNQNKQHSAAGVLFAQLSAEFPDHKDAAEWAFMHGKALQASDQPAAAIPVLNAVLKPFPMATQLISREEAAALGALPFGKKHPIREDRVTIG